MPFVFVPYVYLPFQQLLHLNLSCFTVSFTDVKIFFYFKMLIIQGISLHQRNCTNRRNVLCFIICRGRLLHGRHFTYKSINGDTAITFVSTGVEGAFATEEHPYAAHGPWLQVLTHLWSKFLCSKAFIWANHSPCVDIIDWRVCGADAWGYTRTVHSWRGQ